MSAGDGGDGGDRRLIDRLLEPDALRAQPPRVANPVVDPDAPRLPGHVELLGIAKAFERGRGPARPALADVELVVPGGQIVALIGPNGSGKSTLLRIVAGLIRPDRGEVRIDGAPITRPDARIGLVFQEPRLLPWRTVRGNVAYPLELAGAPRSVIDDRVTELLDLVGLDTSADVVPSRLSGGMRQRAALARGLALAPEVLLLDEPFSALDALTRDRFNLELLKLWNRMRTTIVLVTHSIQEAILVADRVVVLSPGPGHVLADLRVPFDRPRRLAMLDAPEAGVLAGRIRELLEAAA
ncbi:MAG TPA: ABC transporter ATP-binding protein [Candidatus Limnocylindrales bacterium]|jgi:NitT/TauT family transport system ATP-binding protein